MRLEALYLDFFGHFSGKKFEFGSVSESQPDFHVIYGPNEAGKTTFMEGYLRLLYGFLPREPYDFAQTRKNLRVSGVLNIEGDSRLLVRLPSTKNSLLDHSGTPISESALQASLGGLAMQDYRNLLCIDDETIEKGGEEIVNSQGDIGTLLFSAAAGISDLSSVLSDVREQADELFKKNATRTKLATLKSQLKDLDKQITEQDVSASQYKRLKALLKSANAERDEVKARRLDLYREQNQIQKQWEALPLLKEIDELELGLADVLHYPSDLDIESEQLLSMHKAETNAATDIGRYSKELEDFNIELEQITLDEKQLSIAESLELLQPLYTSYSTARLGLESERQRLADVLQQMLLAVRDFAGESVDPVPLLLSRAHINDLEQCVKDKHKVTEEYSSAKARLQHIETRVADKKTRLSTLAPLDDKGALVSGILEEFNGEIFMSESLAATRRVYEAETEVGRALDKLAIKGQEFTNAPICTIHSAEVEEMTGQLDTQGSDITKILQDKEEAEVQIQTLQAQITTIQDLPDFTDDERVATDKQARNVAWQDHRKDYLPTSADVFEALLLQHDRSMEGQVAHASKLGELRSLRQRITEEKVRIDSMQDQAARLIASREAIESTIAAAVRAAGLDVTITPSMAKNWLRECESAADKERAAERVRLEEAPTLDKAKRLHNALSQHIVRDESTLQGLVLAAREIQINYQEQQKQLVEEQTALRNLEAEHAQGVESVALLSEAASESAQAWIEMVDKVFSLAVDPEKLEPALSALHTLRELERDRVMSLQQIQNMESAITQFSIEIASLSEQMDVTTHENIEDTYKALKSSSKETMTAHQRRIALLEFINKTEESLAQAQAALEATGSLREQLARPFSNAIATSNVHELISAERVARETIEGRKKKTEIQKQLLQLLDLSTLDKARDQLTSLDASALQIRIRELEADIKLVDEQHDAAIEKRTQSESALNAVVGDSTIAELDQQRTTIELEMSEVALEHLKLSLGHKLAQKAIMLYREKHRSSMMQATESVFIELTNGAYNRLKTITNGSMETLQVVQANGTAKSVNEPAKGRRADNKGPRSDLSKGTRFQLYLALRAAAYEQLAAQGTCLPFICDDIFETFDEGRTRAACRVLQRIGSTGQAIYLTHHQHVVDIATAECGEQVTIHTL